MIEYFIWYIFGCYRGLECEKFDKVILSILRILESGGNGLIFKVMKCSVGFGFLYLGRR